MTGDFIMANSLLTVWADFFKSRRNAFGVFLRAENDWLPEVLHSLSCRYPHTTIRHTLDVGRACGAFEGIPAGKAIKRISRTFHLLKFDEVLLEHDQRFFRPRTITTDRPFFRSEEHHPVTSIPLGDVGLPLRDTPERVFSLARDAPGSDVIKAIKSRADELSVQYWLGLAQVFCCLLEQSHPHAHTFVAFDNGGR